VEPFAFDAAYRSFSGRGRMDTDDKQLVAASVARYIARIGETWTSWAPLRFGCYAALACFAYCCRKSISNSTMPNYLHGGSAPTLTA
jgi:hypothetical protein